MTEKTAEEKSALIDQTIIGAYEWFKSAPQSAIKDDPQGRTWRDKAKTDMMDKLTRAPFDFNDLAVAARVGISLEKEVYRYARMQKLVGSEHMQKLIQHCIGGEYQKKLSKGMTIAGEKCYLFGKIDTWWPDRMTDLKTTKAKPGRPFDGEKYATSFQGILYSYLNKTKQFDYLVAELEHDSTEEKPTIKEVHLVESGFWGSPEALEKIVIDKITWFIEGLKEDGLWDIYKNQYCLY